jgi:SulP family sulfate permease
MNHSPHHPASSPASGQRDNPFVPLKAGWLSMATDWWQSWKDVARSTGFVSDLLAGLTVAAVALPLNVALAVASGLPPVAGLIAGAVGGGIAAAFGGAPFQVTGPAAALNVMVLALMRTLRRDGRRGGVR